MDFVSQFINAYSPNLSKKTYALSVLNATERYFKLKKDLFNSKSFLFLLKWI